MIFIAAATAAACAGVSALQGCGTGESGEARIKIVATTFPIYDWTREVLGDKTNGVEVVLLQQSGVDLHSYSPSAADLRKIAGCDLFAFVGGESDEWTERALVQKGKTRRRVLNLMKTPGFVAKEEKIVEGMEHEHDHDGHGRGEEHEKEHDHEEHDHGEHEADEHEADEHVWLSLRNAAVFVDALAAELSAIDPANAAAYRANAAAYRVRLAALDREYAQAVAKAGRKTLLVADRFPFRYLADDYGLEYFAAFSGCSAESEASFKTVAFLAKKVGELRLGAILTTESGNRKIAETVLRTAKAENVRILQLDSLQSTGGAEAETKRYLDAMKSNLEVLKTALK